MNRPFKIATAAAVCLLAASCSDFEERTSDAPVAGRDAAPAVVIEMPDTCRNVTFKCYEHNGIYTTRYDQLTVIPDDPNCVGGEG
jgi:hypothetical protein